MTGDDRHRPWLKLYAADQPSTLELEHENALAMLRAAVERYPDSAFIKYFDTVLTGAQLDAESDALACSLIDGRLGRGERVALYLQNVPQYVIGLLATWKAGGIAVPVNPMNKARELRLLLDDSGARVLICLESLYGQHGRDAAAGSTLSRVITTSELDYQTRADPRLFASVTRERHAGTEDFTELVATNRGRRPPSVDLHRDDVASITYTSGTTGVPKGAMNTHGNVVFGGQSYREWFKLTPSDSLLGVAPLFHVTGLSAHIAVALITPMPLILGYRFDPTVMLDLIREHRPTFTVGSITVFIALANTPGVERSDLASLAKIASGGAPIPPSVVDGFERQFGHYIHNVYGMTETTAPTHSVPLGARAPVDPRYGALSVGVPVFNCDMWVVDDNGREVPTGDIGELVVAGPRVVSGYWEKPVETAAAIVDGRMHTGDVGFIDSDGWFYIVDRKKDMIIASGYKVWPRDVEDVLYSHPAVREAAVVGVADEYRGESVKAFVSLKAGATATPEELISFCRERMASYKYPRSVEILDELPKTVTGKILRRELRPSAPPPTPT